MKTKNIQDVVAELENAAKDIALSGSIQEVAQATERFKKAQDTLTQLVKEVEAGERERWIQRIPEETFSITIEGRVDKRVLANRKFVSMKSIVASSGNTLLLETEAAAHEMLQALTPPTSDEALQDNK